MLDWTINYKDTKHYVVINSELSTLTITRVRTAGGRPLRIVKELSRDTTFLEGVRTAENICKLDDDIYTMVSEHQS